MDIFTQKQLKLLKQNPYLKAVSEKAITNTDEFKQLLSHESEQGKLPRQIFENAGLDVEILGMTRNERATNRWLAAYAAYKDKGVQGLENTRGRPL